MDTTGASDTSGSTGAEPLELVPWGEIIFARKAGDRTVLMTVDRDASGLGPIHEGGGLAHTISADGRYLAWVEDGTVLLLRSGDAEPVPQQGLRTRVWAPRGAQLAAIREDDGTLVVLDVESGDERELGSTTDARELQWAADGSMLALHDGVVVRTIDVDSGTSTELASVEGHLDLAWAPDGSALAIGHHGVVQVVSLATLELATVIELSPESSAPVEVEWSPDGQWLAWIHEGSGGLVRPDGTDPRMLYEFLDGSPAWSASADYVAFRSSPSGHCGASRCAQASVYAPDDGDTRTIGGVVQQMAWAPDADVLVFVREPLEGDEPLPWRIGAYHASVDAMTELGDLDPDDPREDRWPVWRIPQ